MQKWLKADDIDYAEIWIKINETDELYDISAVEGFNIVMKDGTDYVYRRGK